MKITVSINNTTRAAFNDRLVKKAAKNVLAAEGVVFPVSQIQLSIAFVRSERIRQLNKDYRKRDAVTDVLSFAEKDSCADQCGGAGTSASLYLGELAICLSQVKADAKVAKVSADRELAWVVVHGILHLLGYDHEGKCDEAQKMRQKEEFYLSKLDLNE